MSRKLRKHGLNVLIIAYCNNPVFYVNFQVVENVRNQLLGPLDNKLLVVACQVFAQERSKQLFVEQSVWDFIKLGQFDLDVNDLEIANLIDELLNALLLDLLLSLVERHNSLRYLLLHRTFSELNLHVDFDIENQLVLRNVVLEQFDLSCLY